MGHFRPNTIADWFDPICDMSCNYSKVFGVERHDSMQIPNVFFMMHFFSQKELSENQSHLYREDY